MRLAAGLRPDPLWGSYSTPPDTLDVIRRSGGREVEGKGRKGLGIERGRKEDVKGLGDGNERECKGKGLFC